jgi:hypothetical protein
LGTRSRRHPTDPVAITAAVRGTATAILHAVNTIAAAIGLDD